MQKKVDELTENVLSQQGSNLEKTNRLVTFSVWLTWLSMFIFAFSWIVAYAPGIPLAEDWLMVPALTGNEENLASWLWTQNNEHRIPLPKIILLGLLKISHGDFRAGMVFNVLIMGLFTAIVIKVCGRLRGNKLILSDAFIPILLLHTGHGNNFFWSWQIGFILPTLLTLILILLIVQYNSVFRPATATTAGICLLLLPLCGANGLFFSVIFTPFLAYEAFLHWKNKDPLTRKWIGLLLTACLILTGIEVMYYFIGYERPYWNPPSPSLLETFRTSMKFQALGLGPAVKHFWKPSILFVSLFLIATLILLLVRTERKYSSQSRRFWALSLFLIGTLAFALAMGDARAGLIPTYGLPDRYAMLAVPCLFASYFIWELYAKGSQKRLVQYCLLIIAIGLIYENTKQGYKWLAYYNEGAQNTIDDIKAGMPPALIAQRNYGFLHHMNRKALPYYIDLLRQNKIGVFQHIKVSEETAEPINSHK